ncbi:phosphonate metabolism protein/1,5-bisphosphokinase (PRPP-forming) PhnN [Hydrogenophaga sp. NFH-34]|uniref:phosphonate metabolism protein/1,5-bisphosphokinase (PRPP-forming) PhnN n=1 Tax=Hydrogenophaga sp. NFH-34 TaxID=2744446 RepID=UPI001F280E6D|nr:phosphonate metabolism protein/1,5-bisphosphokinase (PRPP-forming) PhnN [Hydrogenophaga sp. NFH-34]
MSRRLVYVIGPSGAGKDSVLLGLRAAWDGMPPAHWARRTITRSAQAGGEAHEGVSESAFERLQRAQAFAMAWQANGLSYGVRRTELAPLSTGHGVFVNGSRAYLPTVLRHWPDASVVHITAPAAVLEQRLLGRRREDGAAIAQRLARDAAAELPPGAVQIVNDGALASAVQALREGLCARWAGQEKAASR